MDDQQLEVPSSRDDNEAVEQSEKAIQEIVEEAEPQALPEQGDILTGTIVEMNSREVVVDIGCPVEGIVATRDLSRLSTEYRDSLEVGSQVSAYVLRPKSESGHSLLSISRARLEEDWERAQELYEQGKSFEAKVTSCNKGGLIIPIGNVRGFVPASQVYSKHIPRRASDEHRREMLQEVVGQEIPVKVIEIDRRRNRLILSERAAMREWREEQKDRLLNELKEGQVRSGVVSSLCDFGAFIDLGGADGLVHLSELSWGRVDSASDVLDVGQEIDVYVLGVDRKRRRIALSLKRLKPEPWSAIHDRYEVGQVIECEITNITDFGAFARLDPEIEGLVHISELADHHVGHPSEVVQPGQELDLRIIRIDAERHRIGLSLRRVSEDEYFDNYDWENMGQFADPDNLSGTDNDF